MTDKPSYFSILTADVRYDERLKNHADCKVLYSEITALSSKYGYCKASNKYFSKLYGRAIPTISKWINLLKKLGYIKVEMIYKENSKEIKERWLYPIATPISANVKTGINANVKTGINANVKDNNININNINTNNIFTQDSINTKDYEDDTTKESKTKNKINTKDRDNHNKDYDDKDNDKESNSNINNNRVNTNKDLKGNIDNECSKDNKGSKDKFDYNAFIEWFNELANKNFRDTETNRKMIRSRLNEGYTKEDVAKVVRLKVQQWKDNQKMNKYLRFTTLFAATNFSNYLQEAEDTLEPQEKKKRESSAKEKTRKTNPVEEKIYQYKLFLSEHPDNKVIKKALEELEQNKE